MSSIQNQFDIRTGVIGLGVMGQHHIKKLDGLSNLSRVYDLDKQLREDTEKKYNLLPCLDVNSFFQDIDAVVIAVPTKYHLKIARLASDFEVHTFIEKPLANTVDDCLEIQSFFNGKKLKIGLGHIERHNPVILKLIELLSNDLNGDILSINCKRCSPNPIRINDVGVIHDLLIHDIDLIRFLTNEEIVNVQGIINSEKVYEDHVIATMQTLGGKMITCEASWNYPIQIREIRILTSKKYFEVDLLSKSIKIYKDNKEIKDIEVLQGDSLENEIIDFLESLCSAKSPLCGLEDGIEAMNIASKVMKSSKLNFKLIND